MKLDKIQSILNYRFNNSDLLDQALTHRSYSQNINNERLEFLGDSVLSLVISENIYLQESTADEGDLSRIRASLVKEEALARVARDIGLGEYIYLGGGELKSGGFRRSSILSDTLEAILGAIYLDSGFDSAKKTILHLYRDYLINLPDIGSLKDAKTQLQEFLQSKQIDLPDYVVIRTTGKSHDQIFTVSCTVESLHLKCNGTGSSRKKAEQNAAKKAMDQLQK